MLKHGSSWNYPQEYFALYSHCNANPSFSNWNNRVISDSHRITDLDERHKFVGDMLEVFSEIFFNVFYAHPAYGLTEYTPVDINEDYGVDATGVNVLGHKSAVQVKFRSNPLDIISYADIAKTFTSAVLQLGMEDVYNYPHTVFLFTNSNGVSHQFDHIMQSKAVIITNNIISNEVDGNVTFWKHAYDMIYEKLNN